jgi:hypothetical protein
MMHTHIEHLCTHLNCVHLHFIEQPCHWGKVHVFLPHLPPAQLTPGSEEEVEIRAATVVAVERMRQAIEARHSQGGGDGYVLSVTLDWWLWERGERTRASDPPHHRTLTIYY